MKRKHNNIDSILKLFKSYQPRPQDVVFKNGNFMNSHPGSHQLCISIIENICEYQYCASDKMKEGFIFGIISTVVSASPSGIFIERSCSASKEQWRMMTIKEVFTKIKEELEESYTDYSGADEGNQGACTELQKTIQLLFTQHRILHELLNEPGSFTNDCFEDMIEDDEACDYNKNQEFYFAEKKSQNNIIRIL